MFRCIVGQSIGCSHLVMFTWDMCNWESAVRHYHTYYCGFTRIPGDDRFTLDSYILLETGGQGYSLC